MYKILYGIRRLKDGIDAIGDVINVIGIEFAHDLTKIHVETLRDLEQIPGEVELVKRSCHYPFEARKMMEGVRFYCLIGAEEAEELRESA